MQDQRAARSVDLEKKADVDGVLFGGVDVDVAKLRGRQLKWPRKVRPRHNQKKTSDENESESKRWADNCRLHSMERYCSGCAC